jgi:hypothetical protein
MVLKNEMKQQCAWCGKHIGTVEGPEKDVSHGICRKCHDIEIARLDEKTCKKCVFWKSYDPPLIRLNACMASFEWGYCAVLKRDVNGDLIKTDCGHWRKHGQA